MSPDLYGFLEDLERNNNREWFQENKHRYEASVKAPLLQLIRDFAAPLALISPRYAAIPKVGGSLFRIYRDVRFSKDKRPYKTSAGVHFRHEAGKSAHAPGFYLHMAPREVFVAMGLWGPDTKTLSKIRQAIVDDPKEWKRVIVDPAFRDAFDRDAHTDPLKRPPRGFDPQHPFVEDLKRRHFVAAQQLSPEETLRPAFLDFLAQRFSLGASYMRFLTTAVGLAW